MIKLQDFARQQGVTDRAIQKHLKTYASELEGLYERKGPNGTWLSDEACNILRSKMKQAPVILYDKDPRLEELEGKVEYLQNELNKANADFRKYTTETAAALAKAEERIQLADRAESLAALNADLSAEIEAQRVKIAEAEKEAQNAQKELTEAHESFEKELKNRNKEAWHHYRVALEIYNALPWWKKRRRAAPEPPSEKE